MGLPSVKLLMEDVEDVDLYLDKFSEESSSEHFRPHCEQPEE